MLRVRGGIAGVDIELTVTTDGAATLMSREGRQGAGWTTYPPDDRIDALRTALESSGFHDLDAEYRGDGVCNDCFLDTVTYGGRSVSVEDGALPPGLADVFRLLEEFAGHR